MNDKLKPCPFCKSGAVIVKSPNENERYIVRCSQCPCALVIDFDDIALAKAIWNNRGKKNFHRRRLE